MSSHINVSCLERELNTSGTLEQSTERNSKDKPIVVWSEGVCIGMPDFDREGQKSEPGVLEQGGPPKFPDQTET